MGIERPLLLVLSVAAATSACRLNPECFGQNECELGLVCYEGRCREASDLPDGGVNGDCTWYGQVRPIVQTYCSSCHTIPLANGATVSFDEYAQTQSPSPNDNQPYFQRMAERIANEAAPMPPRGNPAPSDQEKSTIQCWASQGGPQGNQPPPDAGPRDAGPPPDSGPRRDAGPIDPIPMMGTGVAVVGGLQQGEGPQYRPAQNDVLFVDVPTSRVLRYDPATNQNNVIRMNANTPASLRLDVQGNLLTTEFALRRISITRGANPPEDFATQFMGMRLNAPNDMAVRSDGTVYFSDPAVYQLGNPPIGSETGVTGLYRRAPDGTITQEATFDILATPNGVDLSIEEDLLYLSFTNEGEIRVYDVAMDGSLSGEQTFATGVPLADGMTHDGVGNLYVASDLGLVVFAPDGTRHGVYMGTMPQRPSNAAFGDANRDSLYITTDQSLYRVPVGVPGPQ